MSYSADIPIHFGSTFVTVLTSGSKSVKYDGHSIIKEANNRRGKTFGMHNTIAVSYTHLDVYKRQERERERSVHRQTDQEQ